MSCLSFNLYVLTACHQIDESLTDILKDGYAPNKSWTVTFIIGFAISTLIFYHESFVWPKWRFYSLVCAVGCLMEAGGM